MSKITPIALTVTGNEKAYGLGESHKQSPGSKGFRRYQTIIVLRDDELAEFRRDLGPAKNFRGVNPIAIPSFWEHSVDELMDIADELRGASAIDVKDLLELERYNPA